MNQKPLKTLHLEKVLHFFHLLLYFGAIRLISNDTLWPCPFLNALYVFSLKSSFTKKKHNQSSKYTLR